MSGDQEIVSDPITETLFHKVMILFNRPVGWPGWMVGAGILALALLCGCFALFLGAGWQDALLLSGIQLLFFLGDIWLLSLLPRRRISFGSWQGQIFPLAILRATATIVLVFLSLTGSWIMVFIFVVIVQLVGTAGLIWGAFVEPGRLQFTEIDVLINSGTSELAPIRILHISDLHIEELSRREDAILAYIEAKRPDLILLTGDYVNLSYNRDAETYRRVRAYLGQLRAPLGVYATLGTIAVDVRERIVPIFDGLQVNLLRNSSQLVMVGDKRQLLLLGLDCTHNIARDSATLHQLHAKAPAGAPQVLLYHSPELMLQAVEMGIDLYLCGHTHGGQVRLPIIGPLLTASKLGRRYVMGYYEEKHTQLYVSRGVGFEGLSAPRVRLLARPEITLLQVWM